MALMADPSKKRMMAISEGVEFMPLITWVVRYSENPASI
jgi:hypothetical protein